MAFSKNLKKKSGKTRVIKILITIPLYLETMQDLLSNRGGLWAPGARQIKNIQKLKKNANVFKKIIKILKNIPLQCRNYAVSYYQNLEKVAWLLRLEKLRKSQKNSKFVFDKSFIKKCKT